MVYYSTFFSKSKGDFWKVNAILIYILHFSVSCPGFCVVAVSGSVIKWYVMMGEGLAEGRGFLGEIFWGQVGNAGEISGCGGNVAQGSTEVRGLLRGGDFWGEFFGAGRECGGDKWVWGEWGAGFD